MPALALPEIKLDQDLIAQAEREALEAANAPLPDEDDADF